MPPTAHDVQAGSVLFDRYRLRGPLGTGGMGQVWEADDLSTNEVVALKILPPEDDDRRERFLREGRTLQRLQHPNVLAIEAVLEGPEQAALVMERLEGQTLGDHMEHHPQLPWREVRRIGLAIAQALVAAHEAGIVHRDVKPENVFMVAGGDIKLIDFGIAIGQWGGLDDDRLTQTGTLIGTPIYMSPEQLLHPKEIDAKTDTWSLGVLMYECVAGHSPTARENAGQVFQAILAADFPPLDGCPPALAELVAEMLAKAPVDRPSSFAVVERLTHLRSTVPPRRTSSAEGAPPRQNVEPTRAPMVPRQAKSRRLGRTIGAMYAALVAVGACGGPDDMAAIAARNGLASSLTNLVPTLPARPEPEPPHAAPPTMPAVEAPPRTPPPSVVGGRLRGRSYRPIDRANPYR